MVFNSQIEKKRDNYLCPFFPAALVSAEQSGQRPIVQACERRFQIPSCAATLKSTAPGHSSQIPPLCRGWNRQGDPHVLAPRRSLRRSTFIPIPGHWLDNLLAAQTLTAEKCGTAPGSGGISLGVN